VVAVGETLTVVPLVTVMLPGVITPVPLKNTPVRLADPPALTVAGLAAKLDIDGAAGTGVTFTLADAVVVVPVELVTVKV
jgi:hypothetical protein